MYIPPLSTINKYYSFIDMITNNISEHENFCIIGDLNLAGYKWLSNDTYSFMQGHNLSWIIRDAAAQLNYLCELYNLVQFNNFANSFGNVLDLFLFPKKIVNINKSFGLFNDNYNTHYPLDINIDLSFNIAFNDQTQCRDFKKADYTAISNFLVQNNISKVIAKMMLILV